MYTVNKVIKSQLLALFSSETLVRCLVLDFFIFLWVTRIWWNLLQWKLISKTKAVNSSLSPSAGRADSVPRCELLPIRPHLRNNADLLCSLGNPTEIRYHVVRWVTFSCNGMHKTLKKAPKRLRVSIERWFIQAGLSCPLVFPPGARRTMELLFTSWTHETFCYFLDSK